MTAPIAVLVPEFPNQTHAFFWREISAIEDAGQPVQIFSTRRPPAKDCPHAFREMATARTHYVFPPNLGSILGPLLRRPARTLRAISYILSLSETSLLGRVTRLALVGAALDLVAACRRHKISHIHIHSCANAAHLGALATILGELNYSLTLHGPLSVYGSDHRDKMARASFVSAVTRQLSETLRPIRADMPTPVIMMGVDTNRFAPVSRAVRTRSDPFRIFTAARLNQTKGHRFALRAMAALRDAKKGPEILYTMAGEGPERAAIEAEIENLGLTQQVTLLGAVAEDTVLEHVRNCDALCLTSIGKGEAAPVAVMEAMACGRPVVSSIIGGTPDMISDGVDGLLVDQEDVDAIAAALFHLMDNPEAAEQMGRAARATAEQFFDYKKSANKLLEAIQTHNAAC